MSHATARFAATRLIHHTSHFRPPRTISERSQQPDVAAKGEELSLRPVKTKRGHVFTNNCDREFLSSVFGSFADDISEFYVSDAASCYYALVLSFRGYVLLSGFVRSVRHTHAVLFSPLVRFDLVSLSAHTHTLSLFDCFVVRDRILL